MVSIMKGVVIAMFAMFAMFAMLDWWGGQSIGY